MIGWIFIIIIFIMTNLLAVWALDREVPTKQLQETILTPVVAPGSVLEVEYQIRRDRSCHIELNEFIYDAKGRRFLIEKADYLVGPGNLGPETFVIPVKVPLEAAEGKARYRAIRAYTCNPVHRWFYAPIIIVSPDVEFEIKRNP